MDLLNFPHSVKQSNYVYTYLDWIRNKMDLHINHSDSIYCNKRDLGFDNSMRSRNDEVMSEQSGLGLGL